MCANARVFPERMLTHKRGPVQHALERDGRSESFGVVPASLLPPPSIAFLRLGFSFLSASFARNSSPFLSFLSFTLSFLPSFHLSAPSFSFTLSPPFAFAFCRCWLVGRVDRHSPLDSSGERVEAIACNHKKNRTPGVVVVVVYFASVPCAWELAI